MSTEIIDVADLDCIYLTYDEPKKEEFWVAIQNIVPWARRVDGVHGSDAAHKAAADASTTERFILIDGDNLPDPSFFNQQMALDENSRDCVFRWKARNNINGLMYGNGGLSSWTKDFVRNMRTHEATDGTDETLVEFCFHPQYWSMADCYSTTYPNASPYTAWRAGFREGVKMCLDRGARPTASDFESRTVSRNYDNLCIWQSVGHDAEHGKWAIYGARLGTYLTLLEPEWDYTEVQDFNKLAELWETKYGNLTDNELLTKNLELLRILRDRLGLPIVEMDSTHSKFFKHHYNRQFTNKGIMVRE